MKAIEIKKDIFWVGAADFESRDFHGYSKSPQGTTYNSYLIKDEKTVLFDTVKAEFTPTMLCRLSGVTELTDIDYIVVNHVELDHAGALPRLIELCKPEAVFCSPMGQKTIEAHFKEWEQWPLKVVKTGDSINIGKRNVRFLEARMLHWPDSMFSYIPEDKLLFSNDAFGQNIASTERFADEIDPSVLDHALTEYYYNIVLPYSPQVLKILDSIASMQFDVEMIAPVHGLIFRGRQDVAHALESYRMFAEQKPQKRALIIYDTMWHSTEKMAYAVAEGLSAVGVESSIMDLKHNHHSRVMTELARSGLVIVGSPTHNNGILPLVAGMLTYMQGLRPQNRIGGAFGSFGWSGECVKTISEWLGNMGMELPVEPVKHKYVPGHEAFARCSDMGRALGEALIAKCGQ